MLTKVCLKLLERKKKCAANCKVALTYDFGSVIKDGYFYIDGGPGHQFHVVYQSFLITDPL